MKKIKLARFLLSLFRLIPPRYKLKNKPGTHPEPFFVFGTGRNGSTLLNLMLNQHTQLFLPSEQYFLGNSIIKYQLYNYILWRDLVKIIYAELIKETGSHSWNFSPEKIINDAFHFEGNQRTMEQLIHHIYLGYAQQTKPDVKFWGDTTPFNTRYLNEIYQCLPRARYVFLVRDGRDVVAAYKKGSPEVFGHLTEPLEAVAHWIASIKKYDMLRQKTNVHVVKYEDMVQNPEETLRSITGFLSLDYQPQMLRFHEHVPDLVEYNRTHHKNLHSPIQTSSVGQWKTILSDAEQKLIMPLVEPYLKKFNYL